MRRTLLCILRGALLMGSFTISPITIPQAVAAQKSIPGCADWDYRCGYRTGVHDAKQARKQGQCARRHRAQSEVETPSERGYIRAFERYCPAP